MQDALHQRFSSEFLNRLDEVVWFMVQKRLMDPLAMKILEGQVLPASMVLVGVHQGELTFTAQPREGAKNHGETGTDSGSG